MIQNKLCIALVLITLVIYTQAAPDPCSELKETVECTQTEYSEYQNCVEERRESRKKRQALCPYLLEVDPIDNNPNCAILNQQCLTECGDNSTCAQHCPMCPLTEGAAPCQAQYETCVASCGGFDPCTMSCASECQGYHTVEVGGQDGIDSHYERRLNSPHNITTIIRLTNVVNNTNIVNVPTNVNSTNVNNIHVFLNKTETENEGQYGLGKTEKGSCCYAVQPKTCSTSTQGVRCHHHKHKTCGPQCKSKFMHVHHRSHGSCQGYGCAQRVMYVPQPQPNCFYTPNWPYVLCGGQQSFRPCDGCYDHYGYSNSYSSGSPFCSGCYDDGLDYAPLYRNGPVYRPQYQHQQNIEDCEYINETGGCDSFYTQDVGQDIDGIASGQIVNEGSGGDFAVAYYKCKVMTDDDTVEIRNCTTDQDNIYASRPFDEYPNQPPADFNEFTQVNRRSRHIPVYANDDQNFIYSDEIEDEFGYEDEEDVPRKHHHHQKHNSHRRRKHHKKSIVYDEGF